MTYRVQDSTTPAVLHDRFPDLDVAAVAQRDVGRDRQIVLWYLMRARAAGAGRVSREQVWDAARWLGWDPKAAVRAIKLGSGTFWNRAPGGILYLRAPEKVARMLGLPKLRATYHAPLGDLRGSLAKVRARMAIQAIAAIRRGAPIANGTMAEMAVVDVRTIRRWRRLSRVRSFENYALVAPLRPGQAAADFYSGQPSLRTVRWRRTPVHSPPASRFIPNTMDWGAVACAAGESVPASRRRGIFRICRGPYPPTDARIRS